MIKLFLKEIIIKEYRQIETDFFNMIVQKTIFMSLLESIIGRILKHDFYLFS